MSDKEQVLFVLDVDGLLLEPVEGLTLSPYLVRESPLPASEARAIVSSTLLVASADADTEQRRAEVAKRLQVEVDVLAAYRSPEMQWAPGAISALGHMHAMGRRVVIVGDVAVRDAEQVALLRGVTTRLGFEVYPSHETGWVTSDARLFHRIAVERNVEPKNMIFASRSWENVARAAEFGVRGIWFAHEPLTELSNTRAEVRVVAAWPEALRWVDAVAETGFRGRKPRDHDVRAVVIVVNPHGEIPIEHGILDPPDKWHLPGGGVQPDEQPREALLREVAEELGIKIQLTDVEHVVKIPAAGSHRPQIVFVYTATTDATQLDPWLAELDAARWAGVEEALSLLYPGPYGDAALLRRVAPALRAGQDGHSR